MRPQPVRKYSTGFSFLPGCERRPMQHDAGQTDLLHRLVAVQCQRFQPVYPACLPALQSVRSLIQVIDHRQSGAGSVLQWRDKCPDLPCHSVPDIYLLYLVVQEILQPGW